MRFAYHRRRRLQAAAYSLLALAAAAVGLGSAANATDYSGPFSSNNLEPTSISLSLGDNTITGTTGGFISSYVTFTIPAGEDLSSLTVLDASLAPDRTFIGIASGGTVVVDPSFMSAAGLIGWTLYSSAMDGTDILGDIGLAAAPDFPDVPGATGFTPPLGPGAYSTWIVDGDGGANMVPFKLDFGVSSTPEPGTWALLMTGIGGVGLMLRHTKRKMRARSKDAFAA